MVQKIGKKLVKEINSHIRNIEEGKNAIKKMVSKPPRASEDLNLVIDKSKE